MLICLGRDTELGGGGSSTELFVFLLGDPGLVLVLDDVGEHSSSKEHHVLTTWGIFDPNLKFGQAICVALKTGEHIANVNVVQAELRHRSTRRTDE